MQYIVTVYWHIRIIYAFLKQVSVQLEYRDMLVKPIFLFTIKLTGMIQLNRQRQVKRQWHALWPIRLHWLPVQDQRTPKYRGASCFPESDTAWISSSSSVIFWLRQAQLSQTDRRKLVAYLFRLKRNLGEQQTAVACTGVQNWYNVNADALFADRTWQDQHLHTRAPHPEPTALMLV